MTTLADLGERRIVREILPKYVDGADDDCAVLPFRGATLVATTDPVPPPAARVIGGDDDPYWMGWLLVTINASDLAASGANPLGFLAALEAPGSLSLASFERLLEGIRDACLSEGLRYCGGNLREAERVAGVGMAMGYLVTEGLGRSGALPGHVIASVGRLGRFWADALRIREGAQVVKDDSPVFRPRSQLSTMVRLHARGAFSASIDNSDGLLPSLEQLANASGVEMVLALHGDGSEGAAQDDVAMRCKLGWGDWNVVATMPPDSFERAKEDGEEIFRLGYVREGFGVTLQGAYGDEYPAPRLESERFAKDSWFGGGIDAYVDRLLNAPLRPTKEA